MKTSYVVAAAAALAFIIGCGDLPTEGNAEEEVQEVQEVEVSEALTTDASPATSSMSTICAAYQEQLSLLEGERAESPEDIPLQEAASAFEAIIANTCN